MKFVYIILMRFLKPLRGLGLRRFFLVRKLLELIKSRTALVHGHRMHLDTGDTPGHKELIESRYEPLETEMALRYVKEGHTVVDIGANIGYYTLLFCRAIGPAGSVYAFEPAPRAFAFLKRNVRENGYTNSQLFNLALSDHTGTAKLYLNEYNKGDNRIYESPDLKSVDVRLATLDSVIPAGTHIDFIKIDIQGSEVHALRGMKRVLRENQGVIMTIEYFPRALMKSGTSDEELLSILSDHGFQLYMIDENIHQIVPVTATELKRLFPVEKQDFTNLLCTPAK